MELILRNVRVAFPEGLETPCYGTQTGEGEKKYRAKFIVEKGSETEKSIKAAMKEVAKEQWKDKADATLKKLEAKEDVCFRDGDLLKAAGFQGHMYMSVTSKTKVRLIDKNKVDLPPESGRIYGGCFVNAKVDIKAQDNGFGQRINGYVNVVQFSKDGDPFVGTSSIDDFEVLEVADEVDDFI